MAAEIGAKGFQPFGLHIRCTQFRVSLMFAIYRSFTLAIVCHEKYAQKATPRRKA
jgi:hypothetical protein